MDFPQDPDEAGAVRSWTVREICRGWASAEFAYPGPNPCCSAVRESASRKVPPKSLHVESESVREPPYEGAAPWAGTVDAENANVGEDSPQLTPVVEAGVDRIQLLASPITMAYSESIG